MAKVAVGSLAAVALSLIGAAPPGTLATVPASEATSPTPAELRASHQRMLEVLAEAKRRAPTDNHWLGDAVAEERRQELASLAADADPVRRWRVLRDLAEHELRLGQERRAITLLEQAWDLMPQLQGRISNDDIGATMFRLGVAHLRYGESQNCAIRHTARACILPIRGDGVHVDQEGSRNAMRYFQVVAQATPADRPLHLQAVWLLNLAAMTVGEYPGGVPERFRIPPGAFAPADPAAEGFPEFRNVAPELGLATFNLSGGAVVDDFTGDGHLDVFTTTIDPAGEPHFFVNRGDGTFVERTAEAGLEGLYGGLNLIHGDVDNDGDLDLFVMRGAWFYEAGRQPSSLLLNDGAGRFVDATYAAGLAEPAYPTQTAAFADYDNDGDLDLFVGNEHGSPTGGEPSFEAPSQLFRNDGDGTFTEVAEAAGIDHRGFVKGSVWGDYDGDRFPDLYVSNLGQANRLYRNDGDGTFTEVAARLGVDGPRSSFPVWFFDYDNDGVLDLYVSSYRGSEQGIALVAASYLGMNVPWELPRLYRGDGRGGFRDVAAELGVARLSLPMGANFGDVDGDGWLDFYLGTGYPDYEALMPNVLYRNVAGERFVDVTMASGFGHLQKGHAVSFADYDNDGDLDAFEQMGGVFPGDAYADALFRNPGFGHRFLSVELRGVRSNRAGIGARLKVEVIEGGASRSIYRWVNSGGSFGASSLRQTIGLGRAERIVALEVHWPTSDLTQRFEAPPLDRFVRVTEGVDELELLDLAPAPRPQG